MKFSHCWQRNCIIKEISNLMSSEKFPSILIVDDDKDLCTILTRNLRGMASLHAEGSLAGCLEYMEKKKPSLLLLDNNLPDGFGIAFLKKFKHLFRGIKIILITSDTSESLRKEGMSAGAAYFLCKPFSIQSFLSTVQQVLAINP